MNNTEIEAILKELNDTTMPWWEGVPGMQMEIDNEKLTDWLRTTLTTLTQKHEEEKKAEYFRGYDDGQKA